MKKPPRLAVFHFSVIKARHSGDAFALDIHQGPWRFFSSCLIFLSAFFSFIVLAGSFLTAFFASLLFSIIISPFLPFISEEMYTNLTAEKSVHLAKWPKIGKSVISQSVEQEMDLARKVVETGHAIRKALNYKVRMPLAKLDVEVEGEYANLSEAIWDLILAELNIKNIVVNKKIKYPKKEVKVSVNKLKQEGELREVLRSIQAKRKDLGLRPTDKINLTVPRQFVSELDFLRNKVMTKKINIGDKLKVEI